MGLFGLIAAAVCIPAAETGTEKPRSVKVAAIQCSSELGAVDANRAKLSALVRESATDGAKIVVLPEMSVTGYLSQDLRTNWHLPGRPLDPAFQGKDPRPFAETIPGPSTRHFAALAKELGVYLTVPLLETDQPAGTAAV
jgi:predicted amidohydrolase